MRKELIATSAAVVAFAGVPALASAHGVAGNDPHPRPGVCAPSAVALGYSDALDKATVGGVEVGGLSSLAYDTRTHSWASAVDNHGSDPARIWHFTDLAHPRLTGAPLVLKRSNGVAYNGTDSDNEGLAILPDGRYLVSSETEPSIRIYGRDGVEQSSLPVPARFAVAPAGQATSNATLEGLTISPSGHRVVAAMEGALSGDTDATLHRFLVYDADRHGRWTLTKQVAYRTGAGQRVPEVAAVSDDQFLVEEASFSTTTGNRVDLYSVSGLDRAKDVSGISDLATAPASDVLTKTHLADLVTCPTLGAPAKETQANPLLDNFEGMALTTPRIGNLVGVSLISDDNFSATQTTRVLNLAVALPRR